MSLLRFATATLCAAALTATVAAQPAIELDGNNIRMQGCVAPAQAPLHAPFETLLWSRGGILTAGSAVADRAVVSARAEELASRILYWIDEDDLKEHTGRLVEVRGELGDLEKGELEIERDGDFTEIRLELDGDDETIRVPTSWLERGSVARASNDDDIDMEIATRKVDVKEVKVLGPCSH